MMKTLMALMILFSNGVAQAKPDPFEEYHGSSMASVSTCEYAELVEQSGDEPSKIECNEFKAIAAATSTKDSQGFEFESMDGKYKCTKDRRYPELTVDFKDCRKLLKAYNAALAAEMATMQGLQVSDITAQGRITKNQQKAFEDGTGQTAALKGMETISQHNRNKETTKAGLFGLKAVTFTKFIRKFPKPGKSERACDDPCANAVAKMEKDEYLESIAYQNQDVRKAFLAEITAAAGQAAVSTALATQWQKQAKKVRKVEEKWKGQDLESNAMMFNQNICQQNPNAAACKPAPGQRVVNDPNSFGSFNGQANDAVNYDIDLSDNPELDSAIIAKDSGLNDDAAGALGRIIGDDQGAVSGNDFNAPGAAKVTPGSNKGSGGGSAGPAGGGGGGGGGGSPTERANDVIDNKIAASKMGFGEKKRGSGGFKSYSGSSRRSAINKKSSKVDDPFAGLIGNNRVPANESPVHKKASDLFKKISERYNMVSEDKRITVKK